MPRIEPECGPKCRSKKHALSLNASIIRGTCQEVRSYFKLCYNAGQNLDTFGRTALEFAASCSKVDIVEWLLEWRRGDLTHKDTESGWTALHRALFYGQLAGARLLIQRGSDLNSRDHEGLGPLDIVNKDRPGYVTFSTTDPNEVCTWGDNSNFTMGHANELRRLVPEPIDTFRQLSLSIKQVVMCKYHTVFLSTTGLVYTCGHGRGGRLGHGDEQTCLVPRLIESLKSDVCTQVAAARDHTVILMTSGIVFTCGLNDSHQLGHGPHPEKCIAPKQLNVKLFRGKQIAGISAGRFHTVIWTHDAIYTFGLNAGQLGSPKGDKFQSYARQVVGLNHPELNIRHVACSDAATICYTSRGDVYLFHDYQCKRIITKWGVVVNKLLVTGGHLDHSNLPDMLNAKGGKEIHVVMLSNTGKVFVWRACSPTVKRCHFAIKRQLYITDVALSAAMSLMLVTDYGETFIGTLKSKSSTTPHQPASSSSSSKVSVHEPGAGGANFSMIRLIDLMLKDEVEDVHVHRVPLAYRVTAAAMDFKGLNFALIQTIPQASLREVPSVTSSNICQDYARLLADTDASDVIHDVIIQIGDKQWPAHKYILSSRCDHFHKRFAHELTNNNYLSENSTEIIKLQNIHPAIFQLVLMYIYTDSCDLLNIGSKFKLKSTETNKEFLNGSSHDRNSVTYNYGSNIKPTAAADSAKETKRKKNRKKQQHDPVHVEEQEKGEDPVKLLQAAGQQLGVKALSKRLEAVQYSNGVIQSTGKYLPVPVIKFFRNKLQNLCDVSLKCDGGEILHCHKCVLVARSEYFMSMFASSWIETLSSSALSLPVPEDILSVVVDYLYTDEAPVISDGLSAEFICNVLVVADQLLLVRLKDMCEVSLTNLLTLKNAAELLEFASMYNADQLKISSQQFISLNLATMLESRGLDVLTDDVIKDLTDYYKENTRGMYRRVLTPYYDPPSKDYLEYLAAELANDDDLLQTHDSAKKKAKTKKRRSRNQSSGDDGFTAEIPVRVRRPERQISISSDISVKSEEEEEEMETKRTSNKVNEDLYISDRMTGIHQEIEAPTETTEQMKFIPKSQIWPSVRPMPLPMKITPDTAEYQPALVNLRDIMAAEQKRAQPEQSSHQGIIKSASASNTSMSKKHTKFPKARKRVLSESTLEKQPETESESVAHKEAVNPWYSMSGVVKSFRELMLEEKQVDVLPLSDRTALKKDAVSSSTNPKHQTLFSWGLPMSSTQRNRSISSSEQISPPVSPQSPTENPWQGQKPDQASSSSVIFSEIVKDELLQKETYEKIRKKPLPLIQLEERAIQELLVQYEAETTYDLNITVERVTPTAAMPIWPVSRR